MIAEIVFIIISVVMVLSALMVVFSRNIFRAALFLLACFFSIACLYIMLSADFLAAVQVLIYIGAIGILLIFAIMLTKEIQKGNISNMLSWPALIASFLLLVLISVSVINTRWPVAELPPAGNTTAAIGHALYSLDGFLFPFEIASVLLLAAIIGVVFLVKEK